MNKLELFLRRIQGSISQIGSHEVTCQCCSLPYSLCQPHYTEYLLDREIFALCEKCWSGLTVKERLPYYARRHSTWVVAGDTRNLWPNIEEAVLEGK